MIPTIENRVFLASVLLLILLLNVNCTKSSPKPTYIPASTSVVDKQFNFHVVAPGIWRSAQPNRGSLIRMANHGLKTMINLRGDADTDRWERAIADSLGLFYFNFSIDARQKQNPGNIEQILAIMHNPGNQPVLIHCLGGKDRTGMLSAIYKIRYLGSNSENAYREMLMYGYHEKDYPEVLQAVKLFTKAN